MAFKPEAGQAFHLYAQHSDKVLGLTGTHKGATLEQQDFDPKLPGTQLFEFHPADNREVFIKPKGVDMYLDLAGSSHDNGAKLCLWNWNANTANQRFKFLYGGGGYYYIQCAESGKVFDVYYASKDNKAQVAQHDKNAWPDNQSANQLFRPVPSGAAVSKAASMPFVVQETADHMKTVVAGIAGAIPEVGTALKGLVNFLWKENKHAAFEQMREYVVMLVKELIVEKDIANLEKQLAGLRNNIATYEKLTPYRKAKDGKPAVKGSELKMSAFSTVISSIDNIEPYFFDDEAPQQRLNYLISLGTLALTVYRERCLFWYEITGGENNPDAAQHLKDFEEALAKYLLAVETSRQRAIAWRKGKVTIHSSEQGKVFSKDYNHWTTDSYNGWEFKLTYNTMNAEAVYAEQRVKAAYESRLTQVEVEFGAELEAMMAPTYLWKYLHPTKAGAATVHVRKEIAMGPYGGREKQAFADAGGQPITNIVVHAGLYIDGLQLTYGGVPAEHHGGRGGNRLQLDLCPHETIVAVYGRATHQITSIFFETSEGRVMGGGQGAGNFWSADPPESLHAHLSRISGNRGGAHIDGLTFHWEYLRDE